MSMKEDARVLRECADRIEALDGFAQHVEELRESANAIDPRIDRPEIGKWFIFRDSGDSFTDWPWFATHDGVKSHSYYGSPMLYTWLEFDEKVTVEGWTVEPFRQGVHHR